MHINVLRLFKELKWFSLPASSSKIFHRLAPLKLQIPSLALGCRAISAAALRQENLMNSCNVRSNHIQLLFLLVHMLKSNAITAPRCCSVFLRCNCSLLTSVIMHSDHFDLVLYADLI